VPRAILSVRLLMSDQEFSTPRPLVLRVEISAEQAASLAPLLGSEIVGGSDLGQESTYIERRLQPISDYAADARTTELKRLESDLELREAEFEADVQFREDRIERWRTELEDLEQTLDRRERDLASYVDQLQGAMSGSDGAWWSRPAGGDGGVR
jgi:chromosome segregation ATPase